MIRQFELVEMVRAYDPVVDEDLLNRAYVFGVMAHGAQTRASGDPYFSHPLEVAGILTDYQLDPATIVTALLHDTVEDTVATSEEIEQQFGAEIARLIDGVTKLSKLELKSEANSQAENFRKLLLAMSDDIRVLLVKLADRLHNMRTLGFLREAKQKRIAQETIDIYAPLAARIGMQRIREELEDLSFKALYADAYKSITRRVDMLEQRGGDIVGRVTDELVALLDETTLGARVSGRKKRPYSIWRKMERDNVSFEQLSDTVAFRVIVPDIPDCYGALGVVHGRYRAVPGRFKDYISTPKRNNYQSLHTTVVGPERQRVEIQIRTEAMHEVAEKGVAAHWQFKQGISAAEGATYHWLQDLLDIQAYAEDAEEFLEHTKLEMFPDQVFCFTPKGAVIALPRGATPVDFAYAVHTEVGDSCVGAKVNGEVVDLRRRLRNGDEVEILRSKNGTPSPAWEGFVATGRARAAIRRFVRQREREDYAKLGRGIAEKAFRQADATFSEAAVEGALRVLQRRSVDDVFVALGNGQMTSRQLIEGVFPGARRWKPRKAVGGVINWMLPSRWRAVDPASDDPVPIKGLAPGVAVHYAPCCHPLPGDRIVGILTEGKGVTIHTIDCEALEQFANDNDRWLDVRWDVDENKPEVFVGRIQAQLSNEPGALSNLAAVIGNNMGNISNLRFTDRSPEFFKAEVDIEVTDNRHLIEIIAALRAATAISSVERVR